MSKNKVNFLNKCRIYFLNFWKRVFLFIVRQINAFKIFLRSLPNKFSNLSDTNYLLGLHHFNNGNINDAIIRFFILTLFAPNFYKAYYQLGRCFLIKGKPQKAENFFKKALDIKPSSVTAQYRLSLIKNNIPKILPYQVMEEDLIIYDLINHNNATSILNYLNDDVNDNTKIAFINFAKNNKIFDNFNNVEIIDYKKIISHNNDYIKFDFQKEYWKNLDKDFNIIIVNGLFNFTYELEQIINSLKNKINDKGKIVFLANIKQDNIVYDNILSSFCYSKDFIKEISFRTGFINTEIREIESKKLSEKYICILSL